MAMLFCMAIVFVPLLFSQDEEIPTIVDPVTDSTGTLTRSEYYSLRKMIIRFEDSTSNQIVVLMVPSLRGNDIRDRAIRILEKNKIGQKGKDNGVLIFIAKDDRQISIEVGYGLEGVLTDALCDKIIRSEIRPKFRENDYYGGIAAAITAMSLAIKGEYTAEGKRQAMNDWIPIVIIILVIVFSVISSLRGRRYSLSSHGRKSYNNWWWGGGGGSGFGSFGGGGGGGWSAGGGSFGGGGASGSW
jgi:uncharacterized protein